MAKQIRDILITILIAVAVYLILQTLMGSFKVSGTSMLPGIKNGDHIIVSKVAYYIGQPKRGDIIIFHSPRIKNNDLVKRIIGLPKDRVEIKNGKVFVNSIPLNEPYIYELTRDPFPPEEVPEGYYFVLGDNRNNSTDSRIFGFLPKNNIIGKAWITYWPPQEWSGIPHYPITLR